MADRAPLDWVMTYEAARSGNYGDTSQDVIDRLTKDNPSYQEQVDKGVVAPTETRDVSNESGVSTATKYTESSIDWSKLPSIAGGMKLPENYMWTNIAKDGSPGISNDASEIVYRYSDPNYGELGLVRQNIPLTPVESMMRSLIIGAITGPVIGAAAGAIGAAAGFGTIGTGVLSAGMKIGLSSAISGQAPNPFNAIATLLKPTVSQQVQSTLQSAYSSSGLPSMPSLAELGRMTDLSNISLPSMPDLSSVFAGF